MARARSGIHLGDQPPRSVPGWGGDIQALPCLDWSAARNLQPDVSFEGGVVHSWM